MRVTVDLSIYPLDVVLRASHCFTARCYVIPHAEENGHVTVELVAHDDRDPLSDLHGKFANALLDAHLRTLIAEETRPIRELLVAQAFCESDLLDRRDIESDEYDDPKGIAG
jgi:His-Xaa-Ser system protein HxsD